MVSREMAVIIVAIAMVMICIIHHVWKLCYAKFEDNLYTGMYKEDKELIEYSNLVLDTLRELVGQISVISFKSFCDQHELSKVNKTHISNLAKNIAIEIRSGFNADNFELNDLMMKEEFYNSYIVNLALMNINDLMKQYVIDMESKS
jgi:hypothetical protein